MNLSRLSSYVITGMLGLTGALSTSSASASPWVGTVEPGLHQDVQTLSDYGLIPVTAVTFPLPWKGLDKALQELDPAELSDTPLIAYQRLSYYLRQHKSNQLQKRINLHGSSDKARFSDFGQRNDASGKVELQTEGRAGRVAFQISANWLSGGKQNFDGSYAAIELNGWNLRLGAIEQWWGPGQSDSLIMSTNARPIPALALSRSRATPSEGWLSILGPWYFTAQMGQLETDRAVPDTRLWMSRLTFQPIDGLDIGFAWSAMWGGEGQPDDFSTLLDILTFRPECANGAENCDDALDTKLGNQIAGYDIRYRFNLWNTPISLYFQDIGEDADSKYSLTDSAKLVGANTYIAGYKLYLEHSNTYVACSNAQSQIYNCYYEHSTYSSGYRYQGRAIGSTYDSDAEVVTLGLSRHFFNGDQLTAAISHVDLNRDQQRPTSVVQGNSEELWRIRGSFQRPWRDWLLKAGLEFQNSRIEDQSAEWDGHIYINAQWSF